MVIKVYMVAMAMVQETLKENAYLSLLLQTILLLGTHFPKKDNHLITYHSCGNSSQID